MWWSNSGGLSRLLRHSVLDYGDFFICCVWHCLSRVAVSGNIHKMQMWWNTGRLFCGASLNHCLINWNIGIKHFKRQDLFRLILLAGFSVVRSPWKQNKSARWYLLQRFQGCIKLSFILYGFSMNRFKQPQLSFRETTGFPVWGNLFIN